MDFTYQDQQVRTRILRTDPSAIHPGFPQELQRAEHGRTNLPAL
jgi:hypothetical protein